MGIWNSGSPLRTDDYLSPKQLESFSSWAQKDCSYCSQGRQVVGWLEIMVGYFLYPHFAVGKQSYEKVVFSIVFQIWVFKKLCKQIRHFFNGSCVCSWCEWEVHSLVKSLGLYRKDVSLRTEVAFLDDHVDMMLSTRQRCWLKRFKKILSEFRFYTNI